MDLAYYSLSLKRIKIDIAQTREGLQRTTGWIETTNKLNMRTYEEESRTNHRKNLKHTKEKARITRKNWKTNEVT